jgi:hypothetical protein
MDITVKNSSGEEVASGELEVDTSTRPTTATFTPTDGTETDCSGVNWNTGPNGNVSFNFQVSGEDNGDFPCGANGNAYTYQFTGHQNANGSSPSGTVNFPSAGITGDDNDTWQAGASEDESYAQSQTAG